MITIIYMVTVILVLWVTYKFFNVNLAVGEKEELPIPFQEIYRTIYNCFSGIDGNPMDSCFLFNKNKLISISKKSYTVIAHNQFEHCTDIIPFIGNKSDALITLKKCILNSKQLDDSVQKLKVSKNSSGISIIIGLSVIVFIFYLTINPSSNNNIKTFNHDIKDKSPKLIKKKYDNDKKEKIPIIHPVAQFKPINKVSITKMPTQNFAKPYPIPMKFPEQSIPILLIPRNNVTYIPINKKTNKAKKNDNIFNYQQPLKNNDRDFALDPLSKPCPFSAGCSSTPKKQILNKNLNINKFSKKEKKPFDIQNVLAGLDDLDLEIPEQEYDSVSMKNEKTRKAHGKDDSKEINKDNQLKISTKDNRSNINEYNKVTKDLIEKVALNVIGNDKDNQLKNSQEIRCPVVYTSNPSIIENWSTKPNLKPFNTPLSQVSKVNPGVNFKDSRSINNTIHNNDINKPIFPNYMASPIVGNPIWNIGNLPDNHTYDGYS